MKGSQHRFRGADPKVSGQLGEARENRVYLPPCDASSASSIGLAWQEPIALCSSSTSLLLRIWDPLPIEALRLRTFDLYQLIAPRVATQRPVVIVDIDEESLETLGQWPWPRTSDGRPRHRVDPAGRAS